MGGSCVLSGSVIPGSFWRRFYTTARNNSHILTFLHKFKLFCHFFTLKPTITCSFTQVRSTTRSESHPRDEILPITSVQV